MTKLIQNILEDFSFQSRNLKGREEEKRKAEELKYQQYLEFLKKYVDNKHTIDLPNEFRLIIIKLLKINYQEEKSFIFPSKKINRSFYISNDNRFCIEFVGDYIDDDEYILFYDRKDKGYITKIVNYFLSYNDTLKKLKRFFINRLKEKYTKITTINIFRNNGLILNKECRINISLHPFLDDGEEERLIKEIYEDCIIFLKENNMSILNKEVTSSCLGIDVKLTNLKFDLTESLHLKEGFHFQSRNIKGRKEYKQLEHEKFLEAFKDTKAIEQLIKTTFKKHNQLNDIKVRNSDKEGYLSGWIKWKKCIISYTINKLENNFGNVWIQYSEGNSSTVNSSDHKKIYTPQQLIDFIKEFTNNNKYGLNYANRNPYKK